MNLKRTFVTAVAAVGLMASIAAPVAMAQSASDTASGSLVLNDTGTFFVDIASNLDFGSYPTSALTPAMDLAHNLTVIYTDTKSFRPTFLTTLSATDFNNSNAGIIAGSNAPTSISSTNLSITWLQNPAQDICCAAQGIGGISNMQQGGGTSSSTADWNAPNNDLGTQRVIHKGWGGTGTGETTAVIETNLHVPAHSPYGIYSSLITVSVAPEI